MKLSPALWLALWLTVAGAFQAVALPAMSRFGIFPDWYCFVFSGRAFDAGRDPYATPTPALVASQPDLPAAFDRPDASTPPMLFVWALAGRLDARVSLWLARVGAVLAMGAALWLARCFERRATAATSLLAALGAPMLHTGYEGQVYGLLALAIAGAWRLGTGNRRILASLLLAAVCIVKPNFLLLAFVLATAGEYAMAVTCVAGFVAINGMSLLLVGIVPFMGWLAVLHEIANLSAESMTLRNILAEAGSPGAYLPLAASLAFLCAMLCRLRRPLLEVSLLLGVTASIYLAPVAWLGYGVIVLPLLLRRQLIVTGALLVAFLPSAANFWRILPLPLDGYALAMTAMMGAVLYWTAQPHVDEAAVLL